MRTLIIFFLMCGVCVAGEINEKYSYKDFMHQSFKDVDPREFNNTIIVGSNFYQENKPDEDIFPDHLENVTFKKCNLDNVKIKEGMVVDETNTAKKIKVQNDLEDWIVEKKLDKWEAKEPLDKARFIEWGISVDPRDIPMTKKEISIIQERENIVLANVEVRLKQAEKDILEDEKNKNINP